MKNLWLSGTFHKYAYESVRPEEARRAVSKGRAVFGSPGEYVAIRVESLSKQYHIGQRERYRTLRDTLTGALYAPPPRPRVRLERSPVRRRRSSVFGRLSHDWAGGALLQLDPRR